MTTIFFSGGNSGDTTPENLLGPRANVMGSYYYGVKWTTKTVYYDDGTKKSGIRVTPKDGPAKRLKALLERKGKNARASKKSRRANQDQ